MKYLGIDFGTKRLGIAISDTAGAFAFPRDVLLNDSKVFDGLQKLAAEEGIGGIVMGDTLTLNGGKNQITHAADIFAQEVTERLKIPVHRVREAWSSQEADRYAPQGRKHNDSSAAAIILQRFLDTL
jgi:putative holliday junction resolvase